MLSHNLTPAHWQCIENPLEQSRSLDKPKPRTSFNIPVEAELPLSFVSEAGCTNPPGQFPSVHPAQNTIEPDSAHHYPKVDVTASPSSCPSGDLPKPQPPNYVQVDRAYDYLQKYKPDSIGDELKPNARLWKVYLDEAENYDRDMMMKFRDTLDALLVFAALFSAVVTTFAVETSGSLQPDYAKINSFLLAEQVQLLRAGFSGNTSSILGVPGSVLGPESKTHSALDVWVNGLFFISLSLSLATALLSVLVKQWLTEYFSLTSGDAKTRALIHQFRLSGFQKWKLPKIIGFLPLLLHISLGVFLIGFPLFVYSLYSSISWAVFALTGITFLIYFVSSILPNIWIECPYRNPIVFLIASPLIYGGRVISNPLVYGVKVIAYHLNIILHHLKSMVLPSIKSQRTHGFYPSFPPTWHSPHFQDGTLASLERKIIGHDILQKDITSFSLSWLFHQTSNASVRAVVSHAAATCDYDISPPQHEAFSTTHPLPLTSITSFVCDRLFTKPSPVDEPQLSELLCALIKRFHYVAPWRTHLFPPGLIYSALESRNDKVIDCILPGEFEIDSCIPSGEGRLLSFAVHFGQEKVVHHLLENGSQVNRHRNDWQQIPPLWHARENIAVLKLLLDHGAAPDVKHGDTTLLHYAVEHGDLASTELLLAHKTDPNQLTEAGYPPLWEAVSRSDVKIAMLLIEHGANVNFIGPHYLTPILHHATWEGSLNAVKLLLMYEADASQQTQKGSVALHFACSRGNLGIIDLLMAQDNKPDINIQNNDGQNVLASLCLGLHRFSGEEFPKIADILVSAGIDVNAQDVIGYTALYICAMENFISPVQYLLCHGADPDIPDNNGWLPIHVACRLGHFEIAQYLIRLPKIQDMVNTQGSDGFTPLHALCEWWTTIWMNPRQWLQEWNWDKNHQNEYRIAMETAGLLLSHGARTDICDSQGRTPLQISHSEESPALERLLANHDSQKSGNIGRKPEMEVIQESRVGLNA